MSSDSRNQREKLKEEYKEHYHKMREAKERLNRSKKTYKITQALKNMNTSELMESFDAFLFEVKSKIAHAEARLDVVLDNLDESGRAPLQQEETTEAFSKSQARQTLKQLKIEMGQLYSEIEHQASSMNTEKTVGRSSDTKTKSPPNKTVDL